MKLSSYEQEKLGQQLCDFCLDYDFIVEISEETNEYLCNKCGGDDE